LPVKCLSQMVVVENGKLPLVMSMLGSAKHIRNLEKFNVSRFISFIYTFSNQSCKIFYSLDIRDVTFYIFYDLCRFDM
jgi:hypothetical protein